MPVSAQEDSDPDNPEDDDDIMEDLVEQEQCWEVPREGADEPGVNATMSIHSNEPDHATSDINRTPVETREAESRTIGESPSGVNSLLSCGRGRRWY